MANPLNYPKKYLIYTKYKQQKKYAWFILPFFFYEQLNCKELKGNSEYSFTQYIVYSAITHFSVK